MITELSSCCVRKILSHCLVVIGDWPVDNTNDFIMNWQLLIVWHAKGEVDKTIDIKQSYIFVEQP